MAIEKALVGNEQSIFSFFVQIGVENPLLTVIQLCNTAVLLCILVIVGLILVILDLLRIQTCGPDVIDAIEDPEGLEMLTALVASGANINLPTEVSSHFHSLHRYTVWTS